MLFLFEVKSHLLNSRLYYLPEKFVEFYGIF